VPTVLVEAVIGDVSVPTAPAEVVVGELQAGSFEASSSDGSALATVSLPPAGAAHVLVVLAATASSTALLDGRTSCHITNTPIFQSTTNAYIHKSCVKKCT